MQDPRLKQLAEILVGYSVKAQLGDRVLIETYDVPDIVATTVVERVVQQGALPFVDTKRNSVLRALYRNATEEQMRLTAAFELQRMEEMNAYIGIRGAENNAQFSDVPEDRMGLFRSLWWHPVHSERRVKKTRWVVLRWPTSSMAQAAGMSDEAFTDFYFDVCTFDYSRMNAAAEPLSQRMAQAREVRILGPGTELTFSIAGIPNVPCTGQMNIPDGECFTAPVRDSVQGTITFNAPTLYGGAAFEGVRLELKDGRIVQASAAGGMTDRLNKILDTDEGARYIGEWSLGFNPFVLNPMRDILFDEKIAGSFHFTPGQAYDEADNGNRSSVHWDMVMVQRPEFGGGEIYFDGELIRKDGLFIPESLLPLNPEALKNA